MDRLELEIARYRKRTPESARLHEQAVSYLPGGSSRGTAFFEPYPIFADHGQGHYLHDVDGNRYLDFMINATSLIMGHAHPQVVSALQAQAARGTAFSAPTALQSQMAGELCDRLASVDSVRFANSGTEATLMALKAARAFTGRHKIAKFEGGYHGSHEYASVSVRPAAGLPDGEFPAIPEHAGQPPEVAAGVVVLPFNDLETTRQILEARAGDVACVIMEPIASAMGYVAAGADFLRGVREVTRELGILLIFDEVQSFRASWGGAQEGFGVTPDMTALGKIIGGGLPVGAFGGRDDVMALFDPTRPGGAVIPHAGTFNANPMTLAAGSVVMGHLSPAVYQRLNALGETLREKLRAVFAELGVPCQVTGTASFFGLHFTGDPVTDYRSALSGDRAFRRALFMGLLNEGVLLQESCAGALNVLTGEAEVDGLVDSVSRVLQRIR